MVKRTTRKRTLMTLLTNPLGAPSLVPELPDDTILVIDETIEPSQITEVESVSFVAGPPTIEEISQETQPYVIPTEEKLRTDDLVSTTNEEDKAEKKKARAEKKRLKEEQKKNKEHKKKKITGIGISKYTSLFSSNRVITSSERLEKPN